MDTIRFLTFCRSFDKILKDIKKKEMSEDDVKELESMLSDFR